MKISDTLADRFTFHSVNILRFAASEQQRVLQLLRSLEMQLVEGMKAADPTGVVRTAFQQRRLVAMREAVDASIRSAYRNIYSETRTSLIEFSGLEVEVAKRFVNDAIGIGLITAGVSAEKLRVLVDDALIEGAPAKEWWSRQGNNLRKSFADQMRQGIFLGETSNQLAQRIRGTRQTGFSDGVIPGITQKARRDAVSLVQTSVLSVGNASQLATYRANADVIKGVQALATLDLKTSDICIARAGSSWNVDTGAPLPGSPRQERFPGPPPWHFRCRTVLIPVVKSFAELTGTDLGRRADKAVADLPQSTRASMDGQVAADMTFSQFLKGKSQAQQIEVLGRGKWELWNDGQIGLSQLIDQRGRPLTLGQLSEAA